MVWCGENYEKLGWSIAITDWEWGKSDMLHQDIQFVTKFTWIKCQNNFLPKKTCKLREATFPPKQCKLCFHIRNIHTQGYITIN